MVVPQNQFREYLEGLAEEEREYRNTWFEPSEGYWEDKFTDLQTLLYHKLPVLDQITQSVTSLSQTVGDTNTSSNIPSFTVTLPARWGGQTISFINFAIIDPYIGYLHAFLNLTIAYYFVRKNIKRMAGEGMNRPDTSIRSYGTQEGHDNMKIYKDAQSRENRRTFGGWRR